MQSSPSAGPSAPKLLTSLALLWLAGSALRMTILAVPPVIPQIHDDLHMTETQVGLLMSLPMVMFALAGIPGSLLIARSGAVRITDPQQLKKMYVLRRILNPMGTMDAIDFLLDKLRNTKNNSEFFESMNT